MSNAYARVTLTLEPNDPRKSLVEAFIEIELPPAGMDEAGVTDYVTKQISKLEPGCRTLLTHVANTRRD